ncbi:MAG: hypothetical protein AAF806_33245, partial [Bacteroidota bacterium]
MNPVSRYAVNFSPCQNHKLLISSSILLQTSSKEVFRVAISLFLSYIRNNFERVPEIAQQVCLKGFYGRKHKF